MATRVFCECQAQVHGLINNCTNCGRVICTKEKEGPCLFCGNPITKKGEIKLDDLQFPDLESQVAYSQAIQHKEKLLDFHRKDIHQSNIIDDQADYYQIIDDVWQSEDIRNQAIMKIIQREDDINQPTKKLLYDAIENQFIIATEDTAQTQEAFRDEAAQLIQQSNKSQKQKKQQQPPTHIQDSEKCLKLYEDLRTSFKTPKNPQQKPVNCCAIDSEEFLKEFQQSLEQELKNEQIKNPIGFDREFYKLEDKNPFCLSMHQPWAQLVIEGFKRIEGRMWGTNYKGPLWIQAGTKVPTPELISEIEYQYSQLYKVCPKKPKLPLRYPTGVLLGVVDMIGFVKASEYEQIVPLNQREEGDTEFKFVFRNPRKLIYPISLRGSQNIFGFDDEVRQIAKKNLMKVPTDWAPYLVDETMIKEITTQSELKEQNAMEELQQQFQINSTQIEQDLNNQKSKVKQQQQQQQYEYESQDTQGQNQIKFPEFTIRRNVIKNDQLLQLAKLLEQKIGKYKGKQTQTVIIKPANSLPYYNLIQNLMKIASDNVMVYYLRAVDKKTIIKKPAKAFLLIGDALDVQASDEKARLEQTNLMTLSEFEAEIVVTYSKDQKDDNLLKEIGQDYSYKTWLIVFQ